MKFYLFMIYSKSIVVLIENANITFLESLRMKYELAKIEILYLNI